MAIDLDAILPDLESTVGKEHVSSDRSLVSQEMNLPESPGNFLMVSPQRDEEIQEVVRKAGERNVPIYTFYTPCVNGDMPSGDGILLNFRRMNEIERIDVPNLMAHIQRGVTFEQLQKALEDKGLTMMLPAAAEGSSVACNYVNRRVMLGSGRYPEVQLSTMRIVLADGDIHKTGSHALSEETADCKEDGGANLSRWYLGSEDIFGIMTRASVYLYPVWESRRSMCLGFDDMASALKTIREIPRHELGIECLMTNSTAFKRIFNIDTNGSYPWVVTIGLRGKEKLVAYQEKRVASLAKKYQCRSMEVDESQVTGKLDSPWYADQSPHMGFYAKFPDVGTFHEEVEKQVKQEGLSSEDLDAVLVSFSRGACAYQHYNFHGAQENIPENLLFDLLEKGAYFDLPRGKLAEKIYSSMPGYLNLLKRIKKMIDPKGILNPGRPVAL
jgi:FAD/FMN-containing dehydrogenase